MFGKTLLNILLFPQSLYKRITDKKSTLYLGIILIGVIDMAFPLGDRFNDIFTGKPQNTLIFNIGAALALAILLGFIDVMFFAFPVFDMFKLFKKQGGVSGPAVKGGNTPNENMVKSPAESSSLLIKVMKVYITSHFLIIPVEALVYVILRKFNYEENISLIYFSIIWAFIVPIWFSGAITRGMNVIYKFEPMYKKLAFVFIFSWTFLLTYFAFDYMINNWVMKVFR